MTGRDGKTLDERAMEAHAALLAREETILYAYPMMPGLYVELVDRIECVEVVVGKGRM